MKVSQELQGLFSRLGVSRTYPKRVTLLHAGEVSRHAYFIESGCIRLWHNHDGTDVSVKFFLPGELCASLQSMHTGDPSKYELETISPCVVRVLDKSELEREAAQTPGLKDYIASVMVHCLVNYQDLFVDRIARTPEDRYRALIADDPAILDVVPLHYIASYLGITPVSLSRIRKKTQRS